MLYPSILVVDDHPQRASQIAAKLQEIGFYVFLCDNPVEAQMLVQEKADSLNAILWMVESEPFTEALRKVLAAGQHAEAHLPVLLGPATDIDLHSFAEGWGRQRIIPLSSLEWPEMLSKLFSNLSFPESDQKVPAQYYPPLQFSGISDWSDFCQRLEGIGFTGCVVARVENTQAVVHWRAGRIQEAYSGGLATDQVLDLLAAANQIQLTVHQKFLQPKDLNLPAGQAEPIPSSEQGEPEPIQEMQESPLAETQPPVSLEDLFVDIFYFLHAICETRLGFQRTRQLFHSRIGEYAGLYGDHCPIRYLEIAQEKIQIRGKVRNEDLPILVRLFKELLADAAEQAGQIMYQEVAAKLSEIQPYLEHYDLWQALTDFPEQKTSSTATLNGNPVQVASK